MSKRLFLCYIVLICISPCQSSSSSLLCQPYGVRLSLGQAFNNLKSSQLLSVRFNTKAECKDSYLTYNFTQTTIFKEDCSSNEVAFSTYSSYVHTCTFKNILQGVETDYMVFGKDLGTRQIPFGSQLLTTHVVGTKEVTKIVAISDWSYMREKQYDRLDQAFESLLNSNTEIDALYISGDIAYDLNSNEGQNYEDFLRMLSQVSSRWPTIITTGNHEHKMLESTKIFNISFQNYGNIDKNVTTLHFNSFNFILFDPYKILYENHTAKKLIAAFNSEIDEAAKEGKPIIVSSHYPLQCSAELRCETISKKLETFWQSMIDHQVVLYLSGHAHTYERLYPFTSVGNFIIKEPPYIFTKESKYLVGLIEGVGGTDTGIIEQYQQVYNFTAIHSQNQTGFGVLSIAQDHYTFEHFQSKNVKTPFDVLMMTWDKSIFKKHGNLRLEDK